MLAPVDGFFGFSRLGFWVDASRPQTSPRYVCRRGPRALQGNHGGTAAPHELVLSNAGYFFAPAAPSALSPLSTVALRGRPPRAPFARAAAALEALRLAPPALPSR
ncbi:MAG: hypothetical protein QOF74_9319 [Caballeronia mineralivorans]|nr:hypothetical protein [Caballeronia mineralivorans]